MHEHSLNGIVHVFAVLSALAKERQAEAARGVEDYLTGSLGLRPADVHFALFNDLRDFYAGQAETYDSFRERLLQGRRELYSSVPFPEGGVWIDMAAGTGSACSGSRRLL